MFSNVVAIVQLHTVLLQKGSLTPQEKHVITKSQAKLGNSFSWGTFLGGAFTFAATQKMRRMFRIPISGGVALIVGIYAMERSQSSCLEEILALHGSQMQKVLAAIIMKNHSDNTSLTRLVSRHFYAENVFDDSRSDSAVIRWRHRNVFDGNVVYGDSQRGNGSQAEYGDSARGNGSQADTQMTSISDTNDQKDSVKSKQLPICNSSDVMDDPLDRIFGHTTPVEEIQLPSGTGTLTKEATRNRKRSHRRRRQHQREVSAEDHVQPQRI